MVGAYGGEPRVSERTGKGQSAGKGEEATRICIIMMGLIFTAFSVGRQASKQTCLGLFESSEAFLLQRRTCGFGRFMLAETGMCSTDIKKGKLLGVC